MTSTCDDLLGNPHHQRGDTASVCEVFSGKQALFQLSIHL